MEKGVKARPDPRRFLSRRLGCFTRSFAVREHETLLFDFLKHVVRRYHCPVIRDENGFTGASLYKLDLSFQLGENPDLVLPLQLVFQGISRFPLWSSIVEYQLQCVRRYPPLLPSYHRVL